MLGTSCVTGKDWATLNTMLARFFDERPRASYMTLVHTVDYMRAKRARVCYATAVFKFVNSAYVAGMLPELDNTNHVETDDLLERRIKSALLNERDPDWIRMLQGAQGLRNRRAVYSNWVQRRREMRELAHA